MAQRKIATTGNKRKRRGNTSGVIIFSAAIIAAAIIISQKDKPAEAREVTKTQIVGEFETVLVPVPLRTVSAGTKVKDIPFTTISYPRHQIPSGSLIELESFAEFFTLTTLPARLPIFKENLSKTAQVSNAVMERIPEGMRAITVRVDATTSVEGWASSGAIVDVMLIQPEAVSIIAEKVKILSSERSVLPVTEGAEPTIPNTVTLLVTQGQALAISTAVTLGKISFALRSRGDEGSWHSISYKAEDLRKRVLGSDDTKTGVNGFIRIGGQSYTLDNGKWIKSNIKPKGFFVSEGE